MFDSVRKLKFYLGIYGQEDERTKKLIFSFISDFFIMPEITNHCGHWYQSEEPSLTE